MPSGTVARAAQVIQAHQAGEPLPPAPGAVCASRSCVYARWLLALQALDLRGLRGKGGRDGDGARGGEEAEGSGEVQGGRDPAQDRGEAGESHHVQLTGERESGTAAADGTEVRGPGEGMQGGDQGEQCAPGKQAASAVRFLLEVGACF